MQPTVADARRFLYEAYYTRFKSFKAAFFKRGDGDSLALFVDEIVSDVPAWLRRLPRRFRTSVASLSRPKHGLILVLKDENMRAALGEERCDAALAVVERCWLECRETLVAEARVAEDNPAADTDDEDTTGQSPSTPPYNNIILPPLKVSFHECIESLCMSRRFERTGESEQEYRLRIWRSLVVGHSRYAESLRSKGLPVEEKIDLELKDALEYGKLHGYCAPNV